MRVGTRLTGSDTGVCEHMKQQHHLWLLVFVCGVSIAAGKDRQPTAAALATMRPCAPLQIKMRGYLHVSRHGSWISDNAGTHGKGLRIESIGPLALKNKIFSAYLYSPKSNAEKTFKATFTGAIACNERDMPVFDLHQVERIEMTPIREAE